MKPRLLPRVLTIAICTFVLSNTSFSQTRFINFGSSWKYLDNNTRPANWETTDFDDLSWASGLGELGYGDGDEVTTVSYGGDAANKYTTTYFRKTINIPNPAAFSNFTFNVERDDGFVIYVNGTEVGRNNLPAGPIAHSTFASVVEDDSIISLIIPNSAFSATFNVIAVEMHQVNLGSSELSFDLELVGNVAGNPVLLDYGSAWRYFDLDSRPANWQTSGFDDGVWRIGYGELGFGEGDEATEINGGPEGDRHSAIYFRRKFRVDNPGAFASYILHVNRDDGFVLYLNGVEIGRNNMPAGAVAHGTFAIDNLEEEIIAINIPASLLVAGTNTLALEMHQENVNSTDLSFDIKMEGQPSNEKLVRFGSAWKYLDNNTRPAGWETVGFNDAAWASGLGELGAGDVDETTVINLGASGSRNAYYFRKTINIPTPSNYQSFTFSLERDDGYVIYVNVVEVHRNNMPAGAVAHTTMALANIEDSIIMFTLPNTVFGAGDNTIAVEVHQQNTNSSDVSFDLEIVGNVSSNVLIDFGSSWRYYDGNTRPTGFQNIAFADGLWKLGTAELGYGDGDEQTEIGYGGVAGSKFITSYYRKTIIIPNAAAFQSYIVSVKRDDGFVLYVNGTERGRNNMPGVTPAQGTLASSNVEDSVINFILPASNFVNGTNVISVEMHQSSASSTDVSFDLQMIGNFGTLPVIPMNSEWKYLNTNTRPAGWETAAFNDGSWASGFAELGNGDGGEATAIDIGPVGARFPAIYFRKTVNIVNPGQYASFILNLVRDDGAVVYVNGVEVVRSNMPAPPVTHNTFASAAISGADESAINSFVIPSSYFVNGNNVIAVEVHQDAATSSDLSFNLELLASNSSVPVGTTLINYTDVWKFLDNGVDQGTAWRAPAFNDATWNSGPAKLGFGDDLEATVINGGPADARYPTIYFRKTFNITNLAQYQSFVLNLMRDDGAVIYVNGTEVSRVNMPAGTINFGTLATETIDEGAEEETAVTVNLPTTAFVEGANTIAVEIHQINATSSDLGFSLELQGSSAAPPGGGPVTLTRSPYLQRGTQNEITVRWRTNIASDSRVEVGTTPGVFTIIQDDPALTTEHIVRVTGLDPDTKYYYRIGTTSGALQGNLDNFFTTVPAAGTRKVRIAAFGDCGRNENNFQANTLTRYRNYLSANGIDAADAWILLGDNAYNSGTETEFNTNFFNVYGSTILKNHKLYPAPGNHDYGSVNLETKIGPYYSLFTMPTNGEGGGVASNSSAFYSYDIGDIHFLSLDSYGTEAGLKMYDTAGAQVQWVKADLAANTRKWVVAYWHHPPYTKGSHNSDSEGDLVAIRENFIRILERNGVDLIICGHSHDYERSYLLKGYYKANPGDPQVNENNFNPVNHTASTSSAKYNGTANSCPYIYKHGKSHHGTVYIVAGNSGADGGVQSGYPHDAFPYSEQTLGGMFYFEADSNRLDAKYIRTDGAIGDNFTIMKGVNVADTLFIISGEEVTLGASWSGGNYVWNTTATTRTITVTPAEGLTNYRVVDNQGCVKDSFAVYANICDGITNTWVGNVSTAWENPANWSCGTVPNENTEVVVIPGTPHAAIINSDVTIKKMTLKTGASVTVTAGFKLDIKEPEVPPGQ